MILVTGATGHVGGELVRALVARGAAVRALVRDPSRATLPAGVQAAAGDLTAPDTVTPALAGVRAAFLLGGFATLPQLLRRMGDAGVDHVVLLTSRCVVGGRADNPITRMWLDSEAALRGSGLTGTVLRPSGFHANALRWVSQLRRGDVVRAPWPGVPIASIDPADIAAVAATVLGEPARGDRELSLSGPQPLTPGDQVATLGRVLGRPLRYEPLGDDEARAAMQADTPPAFIEAFFRFFSEGEYDDSAVLDTVPRTTGRTARTCEEWARTHAGALSGA
jgi:uncharacterized protein YbjT (DUF2867 family)